MTCPRNTNRPGTWDPNYLNFGPRVGLAYTLKNNTGSALINLLFLGTRQQIDDAFQAGMVRSGTQIAALSIDVQCAHQAHRNRAPKSASLVGAAHAGREDRFSAVLKWLLKMQRSPQTLATG